MKRIIITLAVVLIAGASCKKSKNAEAPKILIGNNIPADTMLLYESTNTIVMKGSPLPKDNCTLTYIITTTNPVTVATLYYHDTVTNRVGIQAIGADSTMATIYGPPLTGSYTSAIGFYSPKYKGHN